MKMSTIKVVTMKHDIIFGQQPDTVAISVPVSEIAYPKANQKNNLTTVAYAKKIKTNLTQRPSGNSKPVVIDDNMLVNPFKRYVTKKPDTYTDSRQITSVHKARESKKRAIQSARKNQREQKITLQNIHNVEMSETPRLPTIELKPIVPLCALEEWFANKR